MTPAAPTASRTRRRWSALLPVVVPAVVVVAVVLLRHPVTWYTADSVAQQSIVRTWLEVGHGTTWLPPDTWWLKLVAYVPVELLPLSVERGLLLEVLLINLVQVGLLGWAVWRLAGLMPVRPTSWQLTVPLTALAAVGGGIGSARMLPNGRNVELAIAVVLLAWAARRLGGDGHRPTWWRDALAVVVLALLWLDDPYLSLVVATPLALACLLWWVRARDVRLVRLAGVLLLSVALVPLVRRLVGLVGIVVVGEASADLNPGRVLARIALLPDAVGVQTGITSLFGPVSPVVAVLAGLAVVFGALSCAVLVRTGWRTGQLVLIVLGLLPLVVVAGFLASSHTTDPRSGRYLVLAAYVLAVATALAWPRVAGRSRRLQPALAGALLLGVVVNLGVLVGERDDPAQAADLDHQDRLLAAVRQLGVTKGYAGFWDANTTDYLLGERAVVAPVRCSDQRLVPYAWLTDSARVALPAEQVFLVWEARAFGGCTREDVLAQVGPRERVVPVGDGRELWVLGRDPVG